MGPLGGESAVVSSKASLKMNFEVLRNNLQAMKEGMGMKEKLALDRGVHCQTLKDVMRDISTGRPERALMITSMEGATLCLNLDLFLHRSHILLVLFPYPHDSSEFKPLSADGPGKPVVQRC